MSCPNQEVSKEKKLIYPIKDEFFTPGVPVDLDLMTFRCTEGHEQVLCGAVADIVAYTRNALAGHSDRIVRSFLTIADICLITMVEAKRLKHPDGRPYSMEEVRKRPAMQALHPTCLSISEVVDGADFSDVDRDIQPVPTASEVCLAIALAHAVTALSQINTPSLFHNGAWHAMAAAEAMGVFHVQANYVHYKSYVRSQAARASAKARWIKLTPVRELAYQRRNETLHLKEDDSIKQMLAEILLAARAVGIPLTGSFPERTIRSWFKIEEIK